MKYFYISILLITMGISHAQNSGSLKFQNDSKDYGTLKYGEKAQCDFNFTNTGKTVVRIKNLKSNSRNIEFKLNNSLIKPGESASFSVIYNTEKPGPIRKTITVFTDGKPPVYTLTVKGRVLPKK